MDGVRHWRFSHNSTLGKLLNTCYGVSVVIPKRKYVFVAVTIGPSPAVLFPAQGLGYLFHQRYQRPRQPPVSFVCVSYASCAFCSSFPSFSSSFSFHHPHPSPQTCSLMLVLAPSFVGRQVQVMASFSSLQHVLVIHHPCASPASVSAPCSPSAVSCAYETDLLPSEERVDGVYPLTESDQYCVFCGTDQLQALCE